MDDGRPFRSPQPASRRPVAKPVSPQRRPDSAPEPEVSRSMPSQPVKSNHPSGKRSSKKLIVGLILGVAAALLVAGWFGWSSLRGSMIDSDKYQAVFFTNGQVYFGKLESASGDYMRLTDIYYLQNQQSLPNTANEDSQDDAAGQGEVQLVKLGEEIHGPEDEMIISKEQILFYENLKPSGKVSQSISEHKSSN